MLGVSLLGVDYRNGGPAPKGCISGQWPKRPCKASEKKEYSLRPHTPPPQGKQQMNTPQFLTHPALRCCFFYADADAFPHAAAAAAAVAAAAVAGTTTTAPGSRPRSRPIFDPNETTANSGTASPPSDKTKQLNVSPGLAETTCQTFLQADKNHRKIFRTENNNPRNVLHIESSRKVPREQSSRKVLRAVAATLVVAALLCLAAVLAAVTGVWNWRDTFPYRGPVFNAVKNCRKVHTGPEEPCSNILESTCFDRDRCRGGGGRGEEGGSFSVYVHDETCSRRSSSEGGVEVGILGKAVPSIWSRAAEAFRRAAESR